MTRLRCGFRARECNGVTRTLDITDFVSQLRTILTRAGGRRRKRVQYEPILLCGWFTEPPPILHSQPLSAIPTTSASFLRRYDLFLTRESDAKMAKLNKKAFDEILDANTKQASWERVRWLKLA